MVTVFTLTPQAAAQALQDNGLDALGVTTLKLSPTWGTATPAFNAADLRLTPNGAVQAPFRGTLEYLDQGAPFRDVNGAPMAGPVAAFRLHPQAVARLDRLMSRYAAAGQPHHRLVPETLVFAGAVPAPDRSPQIYEPGEATPRTEPYSFHDNRGLIIDPVAMAAIFADLIQAFPALDHSNGGATGGAGGVAAIAGLASGVFAQVTDLHGRVYTAVTNGPGVQKQDAGATPTGTPDAQGLLTLAAGEALAGTGTAAADRLRLGWATGGVMDAGPLAQPTTPVPLSRQFLRAYAVDLDWHLRGNRTQTIERGVPGDDDSMPADLQPQVRDGVTVDYPLDGPDTFSHAEQVLARLDGAAGAPLVFAVSPQIENGVRTPAAPGAGAHWPTFPAPNTATGFAPGAAPLTGATAAWTTGEDVVVTLPANSAPDGAAVRIYPQSFQLIEAIGEAPSFLRGDGGASIAVTGQPTLILVHNPLGLEPGDPKPDPASLVFDLVITPRVGNRRLFAARNLPIGAGPAAVPPDAFAPVLDRMQVLPDQVKSLSLAPLFGLERSTAPGGNPSSPIDLVRALASESEPREGPRMPTMGRLETVVVSGIGNAANLDDGLDWNAMLSGAWWTRGALAAAHNDANPGNPAGPDTFASGVRVDGSLGYDLARHAVRRVQPMLPLPGGAPPGTSPGWIVMSGGNNMNPPAPSNTPAAAGSSSGVMLQSIAAVCETPELSLLPDNTPLASDTPITFDDVIDAVAGAIGIPSPAGSITVANEDRLINEVRREYFLSTRGSRDALWSLARALGEAEELVYIETAGFARTARPGPTPEAHEIDLVQVLADRLAAQPNLKVVVATPRETDFAPAPFVRRAIQQREEAVNMLEAAAPGRVAAFHPRGFPGRFAVLPTTNVIVDDVWSLTGATHLRRRGMTFDGSAAVASLDRTISQGYSAKIQAQRQGLMATKLGVTRLDAAGLPNAEFLRLARPASAFDLISDLLQQQGLGMISPLWLGPEDASVLPQGDDEADPDGSDGGALALLLAALLSEA